MKPENLIFLPRPQKCELKSGFFLLKGEEYITIPYEDKQQLFDVSVRLKNIIAENLNINLRILIREHMDFDSPIAFQQEPCFGKEEYSVEIYEERIIIKYGSAAGAFHAVSTLKQLILQCGKALPCLYMEDRPDFPVRGLMLDIGRGKIPTMETLYRIIDLISDVKLNHFQLYIQGFPFAYPSFPQVWQDGTPITGEEMVMLGKYCKERFIDFVPNQNSFGHMTAWLVRKEFNDLAECPNGSIAPWGPFSKPLGINPMDERSIEFLRKTYADLLPYFDSEYFNTGCDETHDLGQGRSKEQCDKVGTGRVYLDFLKKINELVKEHNKTMMFWGDIILKYPELIPELPGGAIALHWGYSENKPFEADCIKFRDANIPYYICPSVNTTCSILGRTSIMKSNLINAAERGKKYGAIGYLNTDWGDYGHWQPLSASYAGYCLGAAYSWNLDQNRNIDAASYLDRFIFNDRNNKMGQFMLDAGECCLPKATAKYFNGTAIFWLLYFSQLDESQNPIPSIQIPDLTPEYFNQVKENVAGLYNSLDNAEAGCDDAETIDAELRVSLRLILHGANLGLFKLCNYMDKDEKRKQLEALLEDITAIITEYKICWLRRNRVGGLDGSVTRMESLKKQYKDALDKI